MTRARAVNEDWQWEQMDERTFTCTFDDEGDVFGSVQLIAPNHWYFAVTDLRWRMHREGVASTKDEAIQAVEEMGGGHRARLRRGGGG
jgi:hypothetical protein